MTQLRRPLLDAIKDGPVRESLQWMFEFLGSQPILLGNFKFYELVFTRAETALSVPHGQKIVPKDIVQTSVTTSTGGTATVTFLNGQFTSTNLVITTSAACTVRFFAGVYE
jgi:hypothetical protein